MAYYQGSPYRQPGYGLMYYRGSALRQKGRGLGSFFGNLMKTFIPFAKNTLFPAAKKYILPHATEMARNVAKDVLTEGKSIRSSLRDNGLQALKGVGSAIVNQSGSGYQRKYTRKRKRSAKQKSNRVAKKRKVTKSSKKRPTPRRRRRPKSRRDIFG